MNTITVGEAENEHIVRPILFNSKKIGEVEVCYLDGKRYTQEWIGDEPWERRKIRLEGSALDAEIGSSGILTLYKKLLAKICEEGGKWVHYNHNKIFVYEIDDKGGGGWRVCEHKVEWEWSNSTYTHLPYSKNIMYIPYYEDVTEQLKAVSACGQEAYVGATNDDAERYKELDRLYAKGMWDMNSGVGTLPPGYEHLAFSKKPEEESDVGWYYCQPIKKELLNLVKREAIKQLKILND